MEILQTFFEEEGPSLHRGRWKIKSWQDCWLLTICWPDDLNLWYNFRGQAAWKIACIRVNS